MALCTDRCRNRLADGSVLRAMNAFRCLLGSITLVALACAGCAAEPGASPPAKPTATPSAARAATPAAKPSAARAAGPLHHAALTRAARGARPAGGAWPASVVLADDLADVAGLGSVSQVFDPASGTLYAMAPVDPHAMGGSWRLEAIRSGSGQVRLGGRYSRPAFLAGGYLWAYDTQGSARVYQLDPRTLAVVRTIVVTGNPADFNGLYPGTAGSVWTGAGRVLLRLSARTAAVLGRITLPAGPYPVTDAAVSPDGTVLYVSTGLVGGGGLVRAFSVATGRLLAVTARSALTDATTGPGLVAMPGRVWAYFRTGMTGASALLRARDLAVLKTAVPGTFNGAYEWGQTGGATDHDGVLWWADGSGLLACVDPVTGSVLASETINAPVYQLLGVTDRVYVALNEGVVAITPPRRCTQAPTIR
jgi:hypothetical protein